MTDRTKVEAWQGDWPVLVVMHSTTGPVDLMRFPAAVLLDLEDGVAWLEPGYLSSEDGGGSGPAHVVECTLLPDGDGGIAFDGPKWSGWIERLDEVDPMHDRIMRAWKAGGTTVAKERERFRGQLPTRAGRSPQGGA